MSQGGVYDAPYGLLNPNQAFGSGRFADMFPSPWLDMATMSMPQTNKNSLEWCEYLWNSLSTLRMAEERIISYFLTEVELESADHRKALGDDEQEKWESILHDTMSILDCVQAIDRDESCYGNGYATILAPFVRLMACPKCGTHFPLVEMYERQKTFGYKWTTDFHVSARCPNCKVGSGYHGPWDFADQMSDLERNLRVKLWSPHEIEILCDPWTGHCDYLWKIPEEYKRSIRKGEIHTLMRAPKEVLRAIRRNQVFRFDEGEMFHLKSATLSGLRNRGWGLSRVLTCFRDAWYVQVLRRYNESIALDYIIPFRLITPEVRPGAGGGGMEGLGDPLRMNDMGEFVNRMREILRMRRKDPATWHVSPYPVKYQIMGGEANQLAPRDLLDQGMETLLNGVGTPTQLYRGDLQLQTAPVALRLFEATHHSRVHGNNRFLAWVVERVGQLLSLPAVVAKMKRVTYSDDFNANMALLQLMIGQQVSGTTGLSRFGLDWKNEQRRIGEEARYGAEQQARIQEEQQQQAYGDQIAKGQAAPGQPPDSTQAPGGGQGGQGGQPGAPPPGPVSMMGNDKTPVTPEELLQQADGLAHELMGLPESQKDSELRALKQKNEVLHALVAEKIKRIRRGAQLAGGAMLLGQQPAMPQQ